jgi:sarcosine oxidase subunit beta
VDWALFDDGRVRRRMSDRADVVIVGGGVQGTAAALHLLDAGVKDVRLLERDEVFEATSSAGAGFVAVWAAISPYGYGDEEVAVENYGLSFYRALQDRGLDIDFAQNGLLIVAASEAAWSRVETQHRHGEDPGTVAVDGERIEALTGRVVLADGLYGGIFQSAGAQIFTPKLGRAMTVRVLEQGGTIDTRRPAVGLQVNGGRIIGVETPSGVVETDTVVLAAGAWTNELLRPIGIYLPFVPRLTSRIITEPLGIPSNMPTLMIAGATPDSPLLWIRQHEGGLLWGGVYGTLPRDTLIGADHVPTRFDEIPIDGVLECQKAAMSASRFMPALGKYKSMKLKHGAPCYTPDHRALVGPIPGVEGLYTIAGDNEAGLTHGPGFAKVLTENIVHGSSDLTNLDAWRIDRFDGQYANDADVARAVAEAMADSEGRTNDSAHPTS